MLTNTNQMSTCSNKHFLIYNYMTMSEIFLPSFVEISTPTGFIAGYGYNN